MNAPMVSYTSKTMLSILFIASLILTPAIVMAQEPQADEEKEYAAMTAVQAEKDPAKKTDMAIKFMKETPKSKYCPFVTDDVERMLAITLKNEKKYSQMIAEGEKFLKVVPNDSIIINAMVIAYAENKNLQGFVTFAEKAYATSPNGALAYEITKAYKQLGNETKFYSWADKSLAADPDRIDLLDELIRKNLAREQYPQAIKYAKMCLNVLPTAKKPEKVDEQAWKLAVNSAYGISHGALGKSAYDSKNYPEAIKNLDSAAKYTKNLEFAYYFLGMSYWQTNKIPQAELNFAKAYLLKGASSVQSKKYLDQLWSSSHKDLSGLKVVIERAQQELK
jgi:tetratricopeptide (TPR) repeat protein